MVIGWLVLSDQDAAGVRFDGDKRFASPRLSRMCLMNGIGRTDDCRPAPARREQLVGPDSVLAIAERRQRRTQTLDVLAEMKINQASLVGGYPGEVCKVTTVSQTGGLSQDTRWTFPF